MGLVNSAPYKTIELTSEGRERAKTILAKHRLIESFLVEVMGFDSKNVHEIAEEIEHIDSPPFFRKVKQMLSQRDIDPHGSPIPDVEF